ncbi:GNAT family N-acetyltransferase [Actinomadura oligospora]|uniref:GNAT family N-acetyltransferase n=1 Tax=Actinomadura oligospora TaxID=111804 RepID=UPI0004B3ABD4|nr:GNAT family N-acetyltransferase [Actinomadura oligospora]
MTAPTTLDEEPTMADQPETAEPGADKEVSEALRRAARRSADRAAQAAGVQVRELAELPDLAQAAALIDRVWRPPAGNPLITPELMRVIGHAGGYVVGAYAGDRMVAACVGLLAAEGLHSHIAGVEGHARGRSAGYALKLHQRGWALGRGITTVSWTFDPLISRNAYFNLAKLGAVPVEYLPDFYGAMQDEVNAGEETDRVLVHWSLTGERVAAACEGRPHVADAGPRPVVGLDAKPDGRPVEGRLDGATVLVRIPRDMEAMRASDPAVAREWRHAVRDVLGGLMADGAAVTGFPRDGWYVIDNEGRTRS